MRDVLEGERDDDEPTTYQRALRTGVFCAFAFVATFAGSLVADAVVPALYAGTGFAAGHAAGSLTMCVAGALLWRYWPRIDAVLPNGDEP